MKAKWLNTVTQLTKQYSPELLSGLAVAGVIGTAVLAVRATPKALDSLEAAKKEDPSKVVLKRQIIAVTWRHYIPAGISGAVTIGCIIGATQIGSRRNAALLAGAALADRAFQDYKDEVKELLGERKEQEVREKIAEKQIEQNPPTGEVLILRPDQQLCYDTLTGRYFRSDIETIRRAENEINAQVIRDMWCSHNEFYALIGLPDVIAGEELGWNMDHLMQLNFTSHLAEDGTPCLAIGYQNLPKASYGKVF